MSAVDILTPVPATAAERAAVTGALADFVAALSATHGDIDAAAQALLAAIEAAPAGALREAARLRMVEAASIAHLALDLGGTMPGVPGADLAASLAAIASALAVRALNGGSL